MREGAMAGCSAKRQTPISYKLVQRADCVRAAFIPSNNAVRLGYELGHLCKLPLNRHIRYPTF
jgi:hypothetical protein